MTDMDDTSLTVSDPDCIGVVGTALASVYAGSGYTSVRDQAFTHEDPDYFIAQTAVLFPDADQSRTFVNALADKWNRCVGKTVSVASPTGDERWTVDAVNQSDSQVVQSATAEAAAGYGCQHVLRVVSNVVLEADACHDDVADEAERIVEKLAANVPG
jgi:serine/threonine-protein kinase